MKKTLIISLSLISLFAHSQSDMPIRPDTIKHVAKGNNTRLYHDKRS